MESTQLAHSRYWGIEAEEIVKDYFKQLRIRKYITIAILVAWCLMYMLEIPEMGNFLVSLLVFIVFLLGLFGLLFVFRFMNLQSFRSLSNILEYDCDPETYLDVIGRLMERDKKGKARSTLSLEMALAHFCLNHAQEGLNYLQQVQFKHSNSARDFRILYAYGTYYGITGEKEQIRQVIGVCREKIETARTETGRLAFERLIEDLEDRLSIDEPYEKRKDRLSILYANAETPLQECSYFMQIALLELDQGKKKAAFLKFQQVASEANLLYIADVAKKYILQLGSEMIEGKDEIE